jgi:hypothetical protein
MEVGLIGFSSNSKGIFPALVRFFTKSKFSHTFIITTPVFGVPSVHEASDVVQIVPFDKFYNKSSETYALYKINNTTYRQINDALTTCHLEYSGVRYGYLQLLWFVYRWCMELFGKDVTHKKNWMSNGVICSELVYEYLLLVNPEFKTLLSKFNPDTVQAQDILSIVESRPDLFTKV